MQYNNEVSDTSSLSSSEVDLVDSWTTLTCCDYQHCVSVPFVLSHSGEGFSRLFMIATISRLL